MSDYTIAADVIDGASPFVTGLLGLIPGAGPFVSAGVAAGLGLTSRLLRAGLSPEDIHAIDATRAHTLVAEADSRLDARARASIYEP